MLKIVLEVDGMTCSGCENTIENALNKVNGIIDVDAQYNNSKVYITYDSDKISFEKIKDLIQKEGYKVKNHNQSISNNDSKSEKSKYNNLVKLFGLLLMIFILLLMLNKIPDFGFVPEIDQSIGYGLLFIIGMLTSLHCVSMCGGICISVSVGFSNENKDNKFAKVRASLMYNIGRVVSYTVIGAIVGGLGSVVGFSGLAKGTVAIVSGLFMVIFGISMLNILPIFKKIKMSLPKVFGKNIYKNLGKRGPFYIGILNGFMPCGPLQTMQLYALGTGSVTEGALSMFVFSVGTTFLMLGLGVVSSIISIKHTAKIMKVSAFIVILLGLIMFNRGIRLSGHNLAFAIPLKETSYSSLNNVAKINGEVQEVSIDVEPDSYTPIIVQKDIPVKWNIKASPGSLNGCNKSITIPDYGIEKELNEGDNIVEFVPNESGDVLYTCWMGMISSNIKIVDDLNSINVDEISKEDKTIKENSGDGCACCGS